MINQKLIKKVVSAYGLNPQTTRILPLQEGYRNKVVPLELSSGEKLALIFYKSEANILKTIKTANQVSDYLATQNWPSRRTQTPPNSPQSIVQIAHSNKKYYCCLYNYLPGSTINWENYSMKHIKLLGQVLGWLHHDLESFSTKYLDDEISILEEKTTIMSKYFIQQNVVKSFEQKLKLQINKNVFVQFNKLLFQLSQLPNQQVLHLDFVRGNILFSHSPNNSLSDKFIFTSNHKKNTASSSLCISGVLDFEKTATGLKIIDLARTLAFLIIDCKYKDEQKVKKYFLDSGYKKRGQQKLSHPELLEPLIAYFLFFDFYKFLKHNPYEYLPQNEHFIRTRDWLVNKKLLRQV